MYLGKTTLQYSLLSNTHYSTHPTNLTNNPGVEEAEQALVAFNANKSSLVTVRWERNQLGVAEKWRKFVASWFWEVRTNITRLEPSIPKWFLLLSLASLFCVYSTWQPFVKINYVGYNNYYLALHRVVWIFIFWIDFQVQY